MTMVDGLADQTGVGDHTGTWVEVDTDFWVGNCAGAFLGTVERQQSTRYFARDSARRYVGEYPSLELARKAIVARMK